MLIHDVKRVGNPLLSAIKHSRHPFATRIFYIAILVLSCCCSQHNVYSADNRPPNIVFILADDLGYTDLACYGSRYYRTPRLDKLADEGVRCTDAHTCGANCQPTRAALMSGQYGPRTGIYTVGGIDRFDWRSRPLRPVDNVTDLRPEIVTIAEALQTAGYRTGMFGKWHLGEDAAHHPSKQGFDEAITSAGKHFDFATNPRVDYPKGTYLADFLTDRAVDFITRHRREPFFLYLPHFGVHGPFQAKPELVKTFGPAPAGAGHHDPVYAAMITSVDESVGRVLDKLTELNLSDNTLVIFSSDNGGVGGYAREGVQSGKDPTDNAPLRGGKGMFYEGGHRVPLIARWPGLIASATTCNEPIISVDLFPTLLAVSGAKAPNQQPLDGVNIMPTLQGKSIASRDLFWHFPGYLGAGNGTYRTTPVSVIRSGRYKLLEFLEDGRVELYNLQVDLSEKNDLAKTEPEVTRRLHERLIAWRTEIKAPLPTKQQPEAKQPKKGAGKKRSAANGDE